MNQRSEKVVSLALRGQSLAARERSDPLGQGKGKTCKPGIGIEAANLPSTGVRTAMSAGSKMRLLVAKFVRTELEAYSSWL